MQQKKASGLAQRTWPYGKPQCTFCKTVMRKGEEDICHTGSQGGGSLHMHRACLEKWLEDHPPMDGTIPPRAIEKAQEIESEFERLRKKLLKDAASFPNPPIKKASAKTTRKARSKP